MQKKLPMNPLRQQLPLPVLYLVRQIVQLQSVCRIPSGISLELELAACVLEPCGILNKLEKKDFCHKQGNKSSLYGMSCGFAGISFWCISCHTQYRRKHQVSQGHSNLKIKTNLIYLKLRWYSSSSFSFIFIGPWFIYCFCLVSYQHVLYMTLKAHMQIPPRQEVYKTLVLICHKLNEIIMTQ